MRINHNLHPSNLIPDIERLWELSAAKIREIEAHFDFTKGSPVFTVAGNYATRGWTEWTQGFQYGSAILQYDATGEAEFLELGRQGTAKHMAPHVTHMGVHDHGFNNISTYGNLRRLILEERIAGDSWELDFYEMALKASAAVQARRWTRTQSGGFIYSFNGPHSLFVDTMRSLRSLALGWKLGHALMDENDRVISLLKRLVQHAATTARYGIYYGEDRDSYDVRGRVAHESIFNVNDGAYRCPNSQQGYSPFTTWTRGLAWIVTGFAEELEFLDEIDDGSLKDVGGRQEVESFMLRALLATADYYLEISPSDGVPYWDTGAPGLAKMGDYQEQASQPYNDQEPVDSSAAAIAAQGLLRLGRILEKKGDVESGQKYWQAGLTVASTLFREPYLSIDPEHQGLILHSIYHRPNGWDYIPQDQKIPCGESSMWGDYHARELALYLQRVIDQKPYLTFWGKEES